MSNGPDDPFPPPIFPPPFSPPRPRPRTRRDPFGRRGGRPGEGRRRRGGLPNVAVPIPVPLPTQPSTRPISFPTGPAANDPIFSRVPSVLRVGSIIVAVAQIIDILIRAAQEKRINREQREREQEDRRIARRLGRDNPLQVLEFPEDFVTPRSPPIEQVPPLSRPEIVTLPQPEIEPLELPEISPLPPSVPVPSPGLDPGPIVAPTRLPSPAPVPVPAGVPGIGSRTMPVFVPPATTPSIFSIPSPVTFPLRAPAQFPVFRPIGDPLTPIAPPVVPLSLQPGLLELPQAQPQPQNRRCPKPRRRKKKRAQRRDKCFKGLFREGPFDDQITFKKWVEIDCSSGRELGKRKRPTGLPELRVV